MSLEFESTVHRASEEWSRFLRPEAVKFGHLPFFMFLLKCFLEFDIAFSLSVAGLHIVPSHSFSAGLNTFETFFCVLTRIR